MASDPLITVIMATYNRAALLPRAIESLVAQSFADWELVVVDDGSVDNSAAVVEGYASQAGRIRYQRQENAGLSSARNAGIAAASADYLTFLDSDDEYAPDHLALRLRYMLDHPDVDLIHGGVMIVGGADEVADVDRPGHMIRLEECDIGGTFFMKTSVARELGGFQQPDYGCDHELMQRAKAKYRIEKVNWPTYIYHRETPDSMCTQAAKPELE